MNLTTHQDFTLHWTVINALYRPLLHTITHMKYTQIHVYTYYTINSIAPITH